MGADFLVNFLTARIDFAAGRRAIEELAGRALTAWPGEFMDGWMDPGVNVDNKKAMAKDRARLVNWLEADLALLEDAVEDNRRDTWAGEIGGKTVVLTGGVSWGDVPTEAFQAFDRLSLAGVTRAMGFDW